jgi:hypothetical protein
VTYAGHEPKGKTMTKNEAISVMILSKVAAGMTVREAFDAVLGAGRFEQLASDIYDELRESN